jgi:hypothetical protein
MTQTRWIDSPKARWGLFVFLFAWGLGYIAWFAHLILHSQDFIVRERAAAVCNAVRGADTTASVFEFNQEKVDRNMLAGGWNAPEFWGTWSGHKHAVLVLPVPASINNDEARLKLDLLVPTNEKFPTLTVHVSALGRQLEPMLLSEARKEEPQFLKFPPGSLRDRGCIAIGFTFETPYRPIKHRIGKDARLLGMGLVRATWLEALPSGTAAPISE